MAMIAPFFDSLLPARDAARLYMSLPENPMVITIVLGFEGCLEHAALLSLLAARLAPHPQFRKRVITRPLGLGPARFRDVPDFEIAAHVTRVEHTAGSEPEQLEAALAELNRAPLDPRRPLWHIAHLAARAGSTLVVRVHHCLGDGATLISLLRALSDEGHAGAPPARASSTHTAKRRAASLPAGLVRGARHLLSAPEPDSALQGALGRDKWIALSRDLPLAPLLAGARAQSTTLTALLLAAAAGALRRWHPTPGAPRQLRALLPVNLRSGTGGRALNVFASVFVTLPLATAEPKQRLDAVRAELERIASDPSPQVMAKLLGLAGLALPALVRLSVRVLSRRSSLVISNVAGPREAVHLGGARLRELWVAAPAPGDVALSITLVSYAGRVRLSLALDPRVVREPKALLALIVQEIEQLARAGTERPGGATIE